MTIRRFVYACAAVVFASALAACSTGGSNSAVPLGSISQQRVQTTSSAVSTHLAVPNAAITSFPVFIPLTVATTTTLPGIPSFSLSVVQSVNLQRFGVAFFDPQHGWTPLGTVIGRGNTISFPGTHKPITLIANVAYQIEVYQAPAQTASAPINPTGGTVQIAAIPNFASSTYAATFKYSSAQAPTGTTLTLKGVNGKFQGGSPPGIPLFSVVVTANNTATLDNATLTANFPSVIPTRGVQFFVAYVQGTFFNGEFTPDTRVFTPFATVQGKIQCEDDDDCCQGDDDCCQGDDECGDGAAPRFSNPRGFSVVFGGGNVTIPLGSTGSVARSLSSSQAVEGIVYEVLTGQ